MGSAAARLGDTCSGHGCFPPRPSTSGSSLLFINGKPALRAGDSFAVHTCGDDAHAGTVVYGSSILFVEGAPLALIGSPVSCGSVVAEGSPNFFVTA